jgi:hypothetical protein
MEHPPWADHLLANLSLTQMVTWAVIAKLASKAGHIDLHNCPASRLQLEDKMLQPSNRCATACGAAWEIGDLPKVQKFLIGA